MWDFFVLEFLRKAVALKSYVVKENRLWKSSKPVHSFFTGSGSSFSFNNGHYETSYSIEPEEIPRSRTAPFSVLEYYQLLKDAGFNIL